MDNLKVGDIVTVRSSPNALGISGCKIIQFYEVLDDDNKLVAGALVDAGRFGELCFKRESLYKEPTDNPLSDMDNDPRPFTD